LKSQLVRSKLKIVSVTNLKNIEVFGIIDPYVKVVMGKKEFKTNVVQNSCNPYYNQKTIFYSDVTSELLKIDVRDTSKILVNDCSLGSVDVDLSKVEQNKDKFMIVNISLMIG
jgi:Ca2+-dependent lipid-binding protein